MKHSDLNKIYVRTAAEFRSAFKQEQADAWKVLLQHSPEDLESAIAKHRRDRTYDDLVGRSRGEIMPSAAELNFSISQEKEKKNRLAAGKFIPCEKNGCFDGWIRVSAGTWTNSTGQPARNSGVKRCQCFLDYADAKRRALHG